MDSYTINIFIILNVILLMYLLNNCSRYTSYFGSGPVIFSPDNSNDLKISNNKLEPVYQTTKLNSYL